MHKFFIISDYNFRDARTLAVADTLPEAKRAAVSGTAHPYGRWILDTEKRCSRDYLGRKVTRRNPLGEVILHGLETGTPHAELKLVGIDPPDAFRIWMMTKAEWHGHVTGNDDIFLPMDAAYHEEEVRMAAILGHPVPASVLAEYPDLISPEKSSCAVSNGAL